MSSARRGNAQEGEGSQNSVVPSHLQAMYDSKKQKPLEGPQRMGSEIMAGWGKKRGKGGGLWALKKNRWI